MSGTRLFVYGSLLFPEVLSVVTGEQLELVEAELPDYARYALEGRVYPAIVPRPGGRVAGRLVEPVSDALVARVDAFESALYERLPVQVDVGGQQLEAQAYVLSPRYREMARLEPWDPEAFLREHGAAYLERCRLWASVGSWTELESDSP